MQCSGAEDSVHRSILLPCSHTVPENELLTQFESNIVALPRCPECFKPITFLGRFKKEMKTKKDQVVQVYDLDFKQKTGLKQVKEDLVTKLGKK